VRGPTPDHPFRVTGAGAVPARLAAVSGLVTDGRDGRTAVDRPERPARSHRRFRYALPGAWTAVAFACLVWWSSDLLLSRPDWLAEPPGRDVLGAMVWLPVVTFWQVTADLPMAGGVPSGHGHKYNAEHVDAWETILQPAGWTADKADRLRRIVTADD
jgi:hypothetical protein